MRVQRVVKLITARYKKLEKQEGFVVAEAYLLGALLQAGFTQATSKKLFALYTF